MPQPIRLARIEWDRSRRRVAVATFEIKADSAAPLPAPLDFKIPIAVEDPRDFADAERAARARLHQLFLDLAEATAEAAAGPAD